MRLMISALLLASAAAAVPALAQDHGDQADRHRDGGHHDGGDHRGGQGNGGGQRPAPAQAPTPQAQPAQARPVQAQPAQGQPGRPGGGGGHGQPGTQWHNQPGGGAPVAPAAPAVVRPREGLWAGNRYDHGQGGGRPGGGPDNDHANNGWNPGRPGGDGDHGRPGGWNPGRPGGGGDHGRPGGWDHGGGHDWNRGWRDDHRYDWRGWRDSHRDAYHVDRYRPPYGYGWGYRRYGVGARLSSVFFASAYWIADPWNYRLPPAYGPYRWVRYYNDALLVDIETGFVIDEIPDFFW